MTAVPKTRYSNDSFVANHSARAKKLTDAILAAIKEADASYPEAKHALTRTLGAIIGSNSKNPDERAAALRLAHFAMESYAQSAELLARHGLLLDRRAPGDVGGPAPEDHETMRKPFSSEPCPAPELRPRRDKPDAYPDNCITEGDTPHGYWWRYWHPRNASETDLETAIIVAFQIADAEARKTGKTYVIGRAACAPDAIYVFAGDHPDACNAAINIMFEQTPAGERIRRRDTRTASRH
jgi:hypothetical protein